MVYYANTLALVLASISYIQSAAAHPGEVHDPIHVKREIETRNALATQHKRSLGLCSNSMKARGLNEGSIARRAAKAEKLRAARGLPNGPFKTKRDAASLVAFGAISHNETGVVTDFSVESLFTANTSCILTPETTIGPYWIEGELIRSNLTEGKEGVPIHLELQFINTDTCEPVSDLMIDTWGANATGVYSGVVFAGNEQVSANLGSLTENYNRGVQPTDSDGVAAFDTNFPGHYDGRATHQHTIVTHNYTLLANGTYSGGVVNHIGQIFFEEALRSAVEAVTPYSTNTQAITSNEDDTWAPSQADNDYDPYPEYVYLSDDIRDGLLMWLQIGINVTADVTSTESAEGILTVNGTVPLGTL
ncbi:hypothetical protein LSUE1_G007111 [Lachnellula suecica]|uniref:Intradiol ring-cleavage dioxygenases domain-containing protein n=1 Tax=Lachnellula suecica TaxID=602035 RepID=A0A8T9C452_9HELO|nr:hypothetical protein LSUE1_G007111 [Lachnellula suecica]